MAEEETNRLGSRYMQDMRDQKKNQITKVFDEYKELLKDKTHPDNQTPAYHKRIQGTIHRLLSAAHELDQTSPGEGIFALFTLALTTNLKLKDKIIELEVENNKMKKQLRKTSNG